MSMLIGSLIGRFSRRWLWLAPTLALILVLAGLGWHVAGRLDRQAVELAELRLALALAEQGRAAATQAMRACEASAALAAGELARTESETSRVAAEVARIRGALHARVAADEAPAESRGGCRLDEGQRRAWAEMDRAISGLCDREPGACPLERLRSPGAGAAPGDPGGAAAGAPIAPPLPRPPRGRAAPDDRRGARPLCRGCPRRRRLPPPAQGGGRHPDPQRSPGRAGRRDAR